MTVTNPDIIDIITDPRLAQAMSFIERNGFGENVDYDAIAERALRELLHALDQPFRVTGFLQRHHGVALLAMTRADFDDWRPGKTLTDDEWDKVRETRTFRKFDEILLEAGDPWSLVATALEEAGLNDD